MSFSTLIVRPSGVAPASGGVLEQVTEIIQPPAPVPIVVAQRPIRIESDDAGPAGGDDPGSGGNTGGTSSGTSGAAAPSAPASSSGQATAGNTTGGLPGDPNPIEAAVYGFANLAANPVDTISTAFSGKSESAMSNPATTVGGLVGSSAGKATVGALAGPAAFGGPLGFAGGLIGSTVGSGLGAIADASTSPYSGWGFGNIVRASIPFFGTPIRGSNFGSGVNSQEDEVSIIADLAEESIAMGTPAPEGLEGFGNVANVEAPTTPESEIQSQIDIARANQEIEDMPGPQNQEEGLAAQAIAARGNEAELDIAPTGMDPAGGGAGGGGTVICTALHHHDLFDARSYFTASNYGATLYRSNPSVMRGYWKIARPFVWLVNHTPSHGKYIIRPAMRAIVKHISGHGSPVGALIVKTLSPLLSLLGRKK